MAMQPYDRALDLLAARPYSIKTLRRKLLQHGASAEEVDAVVERLVGAGLLDDAKYALAFARSKLLGSGASARRIREELGRKGVAGAVASDAIEQVIVDEDVDTSVVIERVARKKLAAMGELEPVVLRRRLYAFLARRGYEVDEIRGVVRKLIGG